MEAAFGIPVRHQQQHGVGSHVDCGKARHEGASL
jgi:hypothetical protein